MLGLTPFALHERFYAEFDIRGVDDWVDIIRSIPPIIRGSFEDQANVFGKIILVPGGPLLEEAEKCLEKARIDLSRSSIKGRRRLWMKHLKSHLSRILNVSWSTIGDRLEDVGFDGFFDKFCDEEGILPN